MATPNITVDEMMTMLSPNLQNDVIRDLCAGFLDMRRATRKPLTKMAWRIVANKTLIPQPWTDLEFACALMKSTEASWQGVFPPNDAVLQEYGPIYVSLAEALMKGKTEPKTETGRITDRQMTPDEMRNALANGGAGTC